MGRGESYVEADFTLLEYDAIHAQLMNQVNSHFL
jgi:hypothetical protein